jgi:hypothetical protein
MGGQREKYPHRCGLVTVMIPDLLKSTGISGMRRSKGGARCASPDLVP